MTAGAGSCAGAENTGHGGVRGAWGCLPAGMACPASLLWGLRAASQEVLEPLEPWSSLQHREGEIFPPRGPGAAELGAGCDQYRGEAATTAQVAHGCCCLGLAQPFHGDPTRRFPTALRSRCGLCLRSLPLPAPRASARSCRCFEVTATLALPGRAPSFIFKPLFALISTRALPRCRCQGEP